MPSVEHVCMQIQFVRPLAERLYLNFPILALGCSAVALLTAHGCSVCAESSDLDLGEEICAKADELEARAVVLLHHGKGMVKEMMFGSITSFATRNCKRPLLVYYG